MKARKKKRILSLLLAAVLSFGIIPLNVSASESASPASIEEMQTYITNERLENPDVIMNGNPQSGSLQRDASYLVSCNISAAFMDYGLHIQLETGTTKTASKLGVKDIKVQQKNGIFWTTIATSDGGSITNDDWYMGISKCTNAVDGEIYRIKCTHFAYIGGNYYHYDNTSDPFTYVKP